MLLPKTLRGIFIYSMFVFSITYSFPTVFRAGEQGRFWYAVLGGSLEVRYHASDANEGKVSDSSDSSS